MKGTACRARGGVRCGGFPLSTVVPPPFLLDPMRPWQAKAWETAAGEELQENLVVGVEQHPFNLRSNPLCVMIQVVLVQLSISWPALLASVCLTTTNTGKGWGNRILANPEMHTDVTFLVTFPIYFLFLSFFIVYNPFCSSCLYKNPQRAEICLDSRPQA